MGLPRTDAPPPPLVQLLSEVPGWQCLGHTSRVVSQMLKPPPKGRSQVLDDHEHIAPRLMQPKDWCFDSCDSALLPHHHTSWPHTLELPFLTLPLNICCWNPWESWGFLNIICSRLFVWCLTINTALSFTTPGSVDWLYCDQADPSFGLVTPPARVYCPPSLSETTGWSTP